MCRFIEIQRDAVPSNITIEFERNASIRGTEVLVVNRNRAGEDVDAVKVLCFDNGKIGQIVGPGDLMHGGDLI